MNFSGSWERFKDLFFVGLAFDPQEQARHARNLAKVGTFHLLALNPQFSIISFQ
jgi:hypothetical protein